MTDTQVSDAARELATQRWGASKPVRLARELAERAAELPAIERARLVDALTKQTGQDRT